MVLFISKKSKYVYHSGLEQKRCPNKHMGGYIFIIWGCIWYLQRRHSERLQHAYTQRNRVGFSWFKGYDPGRQATPGGQDPLVLAAVNHCPVRCLQPEAGD